MPTYDGFIRLDELLWPLTIGYLMSAPWGPIRMEITVDVPDLANKVEETCGLGIPLFQNAIAPAISFLASMNRCEIWAWKLGHALNGGIKSIPGQNGIFPLGKEHAVTALLLTGHTDRRGRRRLYFPACPRSYVDERGQLNDHGASDMLTLLRGWYGGFQNILPGAQVRWINYYEDAVADPITGFKSVGFRDVTHVRLCQYTVPFPDFVP